MEMELNVCVFLYVYAILNRLIQILLFPVGIQNPNTQNIHEIHLTDSPSLIKERSKVSNAASGRPVRPTDGQTPKLLNLYT